MRLEDILLAIVVIVLFLVASTQDYNDSEMERQYYCSQVRSNQINPSRGFPDIDNRFQRDCQ